MIYSSKPPSGDELCLQLHIHDCSKSACILSRKTSLCTPSAVCIPGGPTEVAKDAELQADWIPRQVTSCGAAEYVSYPNGWAII